MSVPHRFRRYRPKPVPKNYHPDYKRYEFEKSVWARVHPQASADEYREAMRDIAQRCGI